MLASTLSSHWLMIMKTFALFGSDIFRHRLNQSDAKIKNGGVLRAYTLSSHWQMIM